MPRGNQDIWRPLRILIVGDPGAGKTTAYGHLLDHGQRLFVADFDANLDPIFEFVSEASRERLVYETLTDKMKFDKSAAPVPVGRPRAFDRFVELMRSWKDAETGEDFGPPERWQRNDWLVIDPLTSLGSAIMHHIMWANRRYAEDLDPKKRKRKKEWGDAIDRLEETVGLLRSLPVNLIVTAHLMRLTEPEPADEDEQEKSGAERRPASMVEAYKMRYPMTLGQKLPPRIGGYFNVVLQAKRVGHGPAAKRMIRTVPDEDIDVKLPAPKGTLPVEVGIHELYKVVSVLRKTPDASQNEGENENG